MTKNPAPSWTNRAESLNLAPETKPKDEGRKARYQKSGSISRHPGGGGRPSAGDSVAWPAVAPHGDTPAASSGLHAPFLQAAYRAWR